MARITVNFPIKVWQHVVRMADERGCSKTEMLRRCVSSEVFRQEVEAEGAHLEVAHPDGSRERVRFPY